MDTLTHRVRRNQLIELTKKEYAVLECLMRQPEYVLTAPRLPACLGVQRL
jgi:DNA-binding response OmpR family regulator